MEYIVIVSVCVIVALLVLICAIRAGVISFVSSLISSVFSWIFYTVIDNLKGNKNEISDDLVDNKVLSRDMGKAQFLYECRDYAESEEILIRYINNPECGDYAAELLTGCYYYQNDYGKLLNLMLKFPAIFVYWLSNVMLTVCAVIFSLYFSVYGAGLITIAYRNYDIDKDNAAFSSIIGNINNANTSFYYDVAHLTPLDLYVNPDGYAHKINKLLDLVQKSDEKSKRFADSYNYLSNVNSKLDEKFPMPEFMQKYVMEYTKLHVSTVNHNYDNVYNDTLNYMKKMKQSHEAAVLENNKKIDAERDNLNLYLKAEEERKEFERQQAIRQEAERQEAERRRIEEENRRIEEEYKRQAEEENKRIAEENRRIKEQQRRNMENESGKAEFHFD